MLNYVHTFVGSAGRTQKTPNPDTDYRIRTTDYGPTTMAESMSIWVGGVASSGFACAVFMLANHLISFRFMPLLSWFVFQVKFIIF